MIQFTKKQHASRDNGQANEIANQVGVKNEDARHQDHPALNKVLAQHSKLMVRVLKRDE